MDTSTDFKKALAVGKEDMDTRNIYYEIRLGERMKKKMLQASNLVHLHCINVIAGHMLA